MRHVLLGTFGIWSGSKGALDNAVQHVDLWPGDTVVMLSPFKNGDLGSKAFAVGRDGKLIPRATPRSFK
jgi:hypothetical protein